MSEIADRLLTAAERGRQEAKDKEAAARAAVIRALRFAPSGLDAQAVHRRVFPESGPRAYGWDSTLTRLRDLQSEGRVALVGKAWTLPEREEEVAARLAPVAPSQPEPIAATPDEPTIPPSPIAEPAPEPVPEPITNPEPPMSTTPSPVTADLLALFCLEAVRDHRQSPAARESLAAMLSRALVELRTGPRQVGILATLIGAKGDDWRSVVDILQERGWAARSGSGRVAQIEITDAGRELVPEGITTEAQKAPARERPSVLAAMVRTEQGQVPSHYATLAGWTRSQADHAARSAVAQGLIVRWGSAPDLRYFTPDMVPQPTKRKAKKAPAPSVEAVTEPVAEGLNLHDLDDPTSPLEGASILDALCPVADSLVVLPAEEGLRVLPPPEVGDPIAPLAARVADLERGIEAIVRDNSVWRANMDDWRRGFVDGLDKRLNDATRELADHVRLRAADKAATAERFVALDARLNDAFATATRHEGWIEGLTARLIDVVTTTTQHDAEIAELGAWRKQFFATLSGFSEQLNAMTTRLNDAFATATLHGQEIDALTLTVERLSERLTSIADDGVGTHDVAALAERLDAAESDIVGLGAATHALRERIDESTKVIASVGERVEAAARGVVTGPLLRIAEVREGDTGEALIVLRGTRKDVREAIERCGAFGVVRIVSGERR